MVIKYTNIYHSKALRNLPKFGIISLKTNHLAALGMYIPEGFALTTHIFLSLTQSYDMHTYFFQSTSSLLWEDNKVLRKVHLLSEAQPKNAIVTPPPKKKMETIVIIAHFLYNFSQTFFPQFVHTVFCLFCYNCINLQFSSFAQPQRKCLLLFIMDYYSSYWSQYCDRCIYNYNTDVICSMVDKSIKKRSTLIRLLFVLKL
jgi:hypothetical protein